MTDTAASVVALVALLASVAWTSYRWGWHAGHADALATARWGARLIGDSHARMNNPAAAKSFREFADTLENEP